MSLWCVTANFRIENRVVTVPFYAPTGRAAVILSNSLRVAVFVSASNVPELHNVSEPFELSEIT